jgi:type II secretion system protein J
MRADIAAIQPRPVVDVNGKHYSALFEDSPVSLSFTTATRYNPGALFDRSTLQRVRYALLNHELIRTTWATLDGYDDSNGLSEVLLTHIDHLVFNFVDAKGNRKDHWEMEALFSNTKLPAGILLDIDFSNKQTFHGDFSIFYQKEGVTY